jgi:hypothetical protein
MPLPEFIHQPGESQSIYLDLSDQPEAVGAPGVFAGQTISSVASGGTTVIEGTQVSALTIGSVTVAGTVVGGQDKTNKLVKIPITLGTDGTQIKVTVRVTWSGGSVKDYEALVNVKNI